MDKFKVTRRTFLRWAGAVSSMAVGVPLLEHNPALATFLTETEASANLPFGADKVVPTICGSGDRCGMYHVGNAYTRNGEIVYYDGCKEANSKGGLCARGASAMQIIYHPDRVKYPMKRLSAKGEEGKFARISWDEAYDTIASKMAEAIKKDGPHTVAVGLGHVQSYVSDRSYTRFTKMFSLDEFGGPDGCWSDLQVGPWVTLGDFYHPHDDDFHHAKLVILWGHNKVVKMPTEWSHGVWEAKRKYGAKLIVVDPRFSETAEKADLYLPVRPGTDAALALGMAYVIITEGLQDDEFITKYTTGYEEFKQLALQYPPEKVEKITWCPADRIRTAARWYATTKPAMIDMGRGGSYSGGQGSNSGWMASRAAACLLGLCGQVGVQGSGFGVENGTNPSGTGVWQQAPYGMSWKGDPLISRAADAPKHRGGVWGQTDVFYDREPYGWNVLLTHLGAASEFGDQNRAESALAKIPFIAYENRFMNYTASRFADIVVPSALWPEQAMLRSENDLMVCTGPAVKPMFESKPTYLFLAELAEKVCKKLEIDVPVEKIWPWKTDEEVINEMLTNPGLPLGGYPKLNYQEVIKHPEGIRLARYHNQEGFVAYKAKYYVENPADPEEIYFPTVGGTGKLELNSPWLNEKFGLPSLPIPDEPVESPVRTPEVYKEYPLISHTRVHRHWGFLQYNLLADGGYASPLIREAHKTASEPCIELNPKTAEALGLKEGDTVWVESRYGKLQGKLLLSHRLHPTMVVTPFHWSNCQNRINPVSLSLSPGIDLPMVGPLGNGKVSKNKGGQNIQAGILCKVYKA